MKCVLVIFIIETILITKSSQHFIPPLQNCVLAEICNHTRLSVCGEDNKNSEYRIFHDECDMFELNCDGDREFVPVEHAFCSQQNSGVTVNIYSNRRRYKGKKNKKTVLQSMKKEMVEASATVTVKRFLLKNKSTTLPELTTTTYTSPTTTTAIPTTTVTMYITGTIRPSRVHFIQPVDPCVQSAICNHTWIPICGENDISSRRRLFGDLCDMLEYNCDFKTEYREISKDMCASTTSVLARKSLQLPVMHINETTTVLNVYDDNEDYLTNFPDNVTTISTYYLRSPNKPVSTVTPNSVISTDPVVSFVTQGLEHRRQNINSSATISTSGICTCGKPSSTTDTTNPVTTMTTTIPITTMSSTTLTSQSTTSPEPSSIPDKACTCSLPINITMTTPKTMTTSTSTITTTTITTTANNPTESTNKKEICTCPHTSISVLPNATTLSTATASNPVTSTTTLTSSASTLTSQTITSTEPSIVPHRECTCSFPTNITTPAMTTLNTTTASATSSTTTTGTSTITTPNTTTTTMPTESTNAGVVACTCPMITQKTLTNATTALVTTTTTNTPCTTTETSQPTTSTNPSSISNRACTCSVPTNITTVETTPASTTTTTTTTSVTTTTATAATTTAATTIITTSSPITSTTILSTMSSSATGDKACTCSTSTHTSTTDTPLSTTTTTTTTISATTSTISTTTPTTESSTVTTIPTVIGGACTCSPPFITTTNAAKSDTITTAVTATVQSSTPMQSCGHPGCDIAVSWATTVKGETRDYYQILRSKYGLPLRRKLTRALGHATRYPSGYPFYSPRRRYRFRPLGPYKRFYGRHIEG